MVTTTEREVLALATKFAKWSQEFPVYKEQFDFEYVCAMLLDAKDYLGYEALYDGTDMVGCIAYIISPSFQSAELDANIIVFYIEPKYRTYRNAATLLGSMVELSKMAGVKHIRAVASTGYRSRSVEKLYSRFGFSLERTYIMEV